LKISKKEHKINMEYIVQKNKNKTKQKGKKRKESFL